MDSGATPKSYKLPILPASPCDALQGKKITQSMIDSALAYDPAFRPSYVYLNDTDAHNNLGKRNVETLAPINRTFIENGFVVAEVTPNRKYRGEKFEDLAAQDGTHPGRSVDLWNKSLIPGCKSDFYLEGIALCGAQKPATVNMPGIYFASQPLKGGGILTFSINTSSSEMTMSEDKNDSPKVDFAAMQTQLDGLTKEVKTLSAERDHYKTESETIATGYKELKKRSDEQEINSLLDSQEYRGKFKADERPTIMEMALSLKDDIVQLAGGKTRYQAYMDSIKSRPVIVNFAVISGGVGNQVASDTPADQNAAITQFATEHTLDTNTMEGLQKAEAGAFKKWPELWNQQGVK